MQFNLLPRRKTGDRDSYSVASISQSSRFLKIGQTADGGMRRLSPA